jgi:hypothetical protein
VNGSTIARTTRSSARVVRTAACTPGSTAGVCRRDVG